MSRNAGRSSGGGACSADELAARLAALFVGSGDELPPEGLSEFMQHMMGGDRAGSGSDGGGMPASLARAMAALGGMLAPDEPLTDAALRELEAGFGAGPDRLVSSLQSVIENIRGSAQRARQMADRPRIVAGIAAALGPCTPAATLGMALNAAADICRLQPSAARKIGAAMAPAASGGGGSGREQGPVARLVAAGAAAMLNRSDDDLSLAGCECFTFAAAESGEAAEAAVRAHPDVIIAAAARMARAPVTLGQGLVLHQGDSNIYSACKMVVHLCQASSQAAAAVVSAAPATVDSLLHLISSRRVLCTSFEGGAEALAALCAAGGPAAAAVLARPAAVATMAAALERLPREITTLRPSNPNPFSGRVAGIVEHFLKAFYALLGLENWADLLLCQPGTATAFRAPGTPAALARAFAPLVGRLQDMPDQCVAALNVLGVIPGLREPGGVLPPNGGNVELEIFSNAQLRAELPALLLGVGGAGGGGPWDESLEREMASPGLVAQGRSVRLLTVCLRDATVWADAMRDAALCRSAARALAAQGSSALRGLQPGGGGVGDMVRMLRLQTVAMLVEVFHFLVPHDPPQGGDASGPVPTAAYEALQADGGAGRRALLLVSQRLVPCSAVGMDAETAAWTVEHADSVLRRLRRLQAACDATAAATAAPAAAAAGASGSSSSSGGGAAAPAAAASSSGGVRTTQVKACLTCGKASGEGGVKLRACAGCGVAFFCNLECQKEGWRGHKRACRAAQAAKAAAEAQ